MKKNQFLTSVIFLVVLVVGGASFADTTCDKVLPKNYQVKSYSITFSTEADDYQADA